MNPKTIQTQFDPETLPQWARCLPQVVELARRDLGYRCRVCATSHRYYRHFLIREAENRLS